jgi:hypothetical protein
MLVNGLVNHRFPSGPVVIRSGPIALPNSVIVPVVGSIRPILLPWNSANHNAPSGPKVMPAGVALAVGMVKNVNSPDGVSLATAFRM